MMRRLVINSLVVAISATPWLVAGAVSADAGSGSHRHNLPRAACVAEDGPGPCFWDAGARGNHRGHSFWIDRGGRIHYLDPTFKTGR